MVVIRFINVRKCENLLLLGNCPKENPYRVRRYQYYIILYKLIYGPLKGW